MQRLLRVLSEPLVQFAVIGAAIFALDLALREEVDDPKLIRVDAEVHRDLARIFIEAEDRAPTSDDMDRLVEIYLRNEALYREALALELDHGDQMMKERLATRMRMMLLSSITVEEPDEAALRAWFEERRDRYAEPSRLSFRVIGLDGSEEEARALAETAAAEAAAGREFRPRDYFQTGFRNRPRPQLAALFDEEMIAAIEAAPQGAWTPVPSSRGWQLALLVEATEPRAPDFDAMRTRAAADWKAERAQKEAFDSLKSLMASYPVERAPYDPALFEPAEPAPANAAAAGGARADGAAVR